MRIHDLLKFCIKCGQPAAFPSAVAVEKPFICIECQNNIIPVDFNNGIKEEIKINKNEIN